MLLHASLAAGLKLFHLGLLVRGQHLEQLVVDARSLYCELDFHLRLLRRQSANLGFVIRTFSVLAKLLFDLP